MDTVAPGSTRDRWRLPVAVAIGCLLVLGGAQIWSRRYLDASSGDYAHFYRPVAERLAGGKGLTIAPGLAALRYPPGYPVLLSGALRAGRVVHLPDEWSIGLVDLSLVVGCGVLLALSARSLFGTRVAIASSVLWAIYPINLYVLTQPASEIPFTFLLALALYLLVPLLRGNPVTAGRLAAVGATLGLAGLMRPVGPLLLAAVAVAVAVRTDLARRLRLRLVAVAAGACVLVVLPWLVWAGGQAGHPIFMSTGGVPSIRDGLTFGVEPQRETGTVLMPAATRQIMEDALRRRSDLESFVGIVRFLGRETGDHPDGMAGLVGLKVIRSWYGSESISYEPQIALIQGAYLALLVSSLVLIRRRYGPTGRRTAAYLVVLLLLGWASAAVVLPLFWYVTPMVSVALVCSGVVPIALLDGGRRGHRSRTTAVEHLPDPGGPAGDEPDGAEPRALAPETP